MAISDLAFSSWPLSKQYLAAHFYLSEEKPISITEAQRAQLGSLHLFVSFGPYSEDHSVAELNKCTVSEKKKRIEEWKSLGIISRSSAMKKFIDMLNCLFPNWTRYRKLHYEFEMEWLNMQKIIGIGKSPLDIKSKDLTPSARKTVSRSLSPIQTSLTRPPFSLRESVPKATKAITNFQKARILPYLPQIPKLNAAVDAKDTIYSLKKKYRTESVHNVNTESVYYRISNKKPEKTKNHQSSNFFDSFLGEIAKEGSAPNFDNTKKIEHFPESFPELNFMQELHQKISVIFI